MVILKSWVFYHQQSLYRPDKVFKVNVFIRIEWGKENHIKGYDIKINTGGSKISNDVEFGTFLDDYHFVFQMNGSHFIRKYIKFVGLNNRVIYGKTLEFLSTVRRKFCLHNITLPRPLLVGRAKSAR